MSESTLDQLKKQSTESAVEEKRADTWKPSPGDMLAGTVVRGDHVMTSNGDARLIVIADEETDKEWTVWCSGKMLKDLVIEKAPALGSLIVVEFHGKFPVQSNPSYSFNKYTMEVGSTDFEYWDKITTAYRRKAAASVDSAQIQSVETFNGSGDDDDLEAPF